MPLAHFLDVTNRDGVQAARMRMPKLQRTMLNIYLSQLGVYQSEFAFPFSRQEHNYILANLELQAMGAMGNLILSGWCRATLQDVEKSLPTNIKHLNLSISTSDQMILHKFKGKLDREKVIKQMQEATRFALKNGIKTVGVNAEDASRTDLSYLIEFAIAAKEAGACRVRYCDTLGCETPMSIYERVRRLAEEAKIPIELHCHNDLGMAVANSIAGAMGAIDGGVDAYINTTVNGIGERAGQADLISCILALKFGKGMERYQIGDPIDLTKAYKIARYVSYALGIPIPINQPGVGANAFAHESGIHVDGFLKDRRNYELYEPEILGIEPEERVITGRIIMAGEFSGLAGVRHVYRRLGIEIEGEEAERIVELVRYASAHTQKTLTEDELKLIATYPEQVRLILTVTP